MSSSSRLQLGLGFGLAWLISALPLIWFSPLMISVLVWLRSALTAMGYSSNWLDYAGLLGSFLLRILSVTTLPLLAGLLLLLPLLGRIWEAQHGCRRHPFASLREFAAALILHSLLAGFFIGLLLFLYGVLEMLNAGYKLPVEILVFIQLSMGAWLILPRSVDNLSAEYGLLTGSLGGLLGILTLAPLSRFAIDSGSLPLQLAAASLAVLIGGCFVGLLLPWLLRMDRPYWLLIRDAEGSERSFRLGRRPLEIGGQRRALAQVAQPGFLPLRLTLSGLTIFLDIPGEARSRVLYVPCRIRQAGIELELHGFDERSDWDEIIVEPQQLPDPAAPVATAEAAAQFPAELPAGQARPQSAAAPGQAQPDTD